MIKTIVKNIQTPPQVVEVTDALLGLDQGSHYIAYQTNSYFAILSRISENLWGFVVFERKPLTPKFVANSARESLEFAMNNNPASKRQICLVSNFADVVNIPISK